MTVNIIKALQALMEHIKKYRDETKTIKIVQIPKSTAKDYNSFAQRTLVEIVRQNVSQRLDIAIATYAIIIRHPST